MSDGGGRRFDIYGDDGQMLNQYRGMLRIMPPTIDDAVCGILFKVPDNSYGVGVPYSEGNAMVVISEADGFVANPAPLLAAITSTTNTQPVSAFVPAHGFANGDIVRITGTGQAALDMKWWKITVTDVDHFTLNGSAAPGGVGAGGWAYTDRSPVLSRMDAFGGFGGAGGFHFALGQRGRSGQGVGVGPAVWVDLCHDSVGLAIHNPGLQEWAPALVQDFVQVVDVRSAPARNLVRVEVDGTLTLRPQAGKAGVGVMIRTRNDADTADLFSVNNVGLVQAVRIVVTQTDVAMSVLNANAPAGHTVDILRVQLNSANKFVVNKDGRAISKGINTVPVLADLADGDFTSWLDVAGNAVKFAARIGGVLKSATVAVA